MRPIPVSRVPLLALSLVSLGLTGCALTATAPGFNQGVSIQGKVYGGQQPISGAHVYLFAAGTSGAGQPSVSLLENVAGTTMDISGGPTDGDFYVTSDASGNFTITGDYVCTANTQVYLYTLGGDPGSGSDNPNASVMAVLGNCPRTRTFLDATPAVEINEVTTIAAAFSFAGYATDATHVSSSGTQLAKVGIANAFATAGNLVDLSTGTAFATTPGSSGSGSNQNIGTVPTAEINTMSDILSACINSDPTDSTSCSTLLANAMNGSTAPTDTATAAINIAHNPGANVAALFALVPDVPPFPSDLGKAPNDWTIVLNITTTLSGAGSGYLAVDASGDIWVTGSGKLYEVSPLGVELTGTAGYVAGISNPNGVAIDAAGHIWVANEGSGSVSELTSAGVPLSGLTGYPVGENPTVMAFDSSSHIWVADIPGNGDAPTVGELNVSDGSAVAGSPYSGGGLDNPIGLAIDSGGNAWIANLFNFATEVSGAGLVTGYSNPGPAAFIDPSSIAIDAAGNKWFTNRYDSGGTAYNLTELTGSGSGFVDHTFATNTTPMIQAHSGFDGGGNLWVTTLNHNLVSGNSNWLAKFSGAGVLLTPDNGFHNPGSTCASETALALDGSGNVWVSCSNGALMEYVGAATPVVTPTVANLLPPYAHPASTP